MLSVNYFYREPRSTGVSIEGIFQTVKTVLKDRVIITEFYCDPNVSRFRNVLMARKFAGRINHITGDVNFLAIGMGGRKNILTVHDVGHYQTLKNRSKLLSAVYKFFWFQWPIKNIDRITVVSEFTKNNLTTLLGLPAEKIVVIPNPVKPVFRYSGKKELNTIPRILQIGSGKHKNLKNLILATAGMNVHLDIAAFLSAEDEALLTENRTSFSLHQNITEQQVFELYDQCDLLFFASHYEGFGMPIIEAQTVGRPVITSNIGAMKEVAGDSALLVDQNDPGQIRDAIVSLTTDKTLYESYVNKGRVNVIPYEQSKVAEQYFQLYQELASAN